MTTDNERLAKLEAHLEHFSERMSTLDDIAKATHRNTALLEGISGRLASGDGALADHDTQLSDIFRRLGAVENRVKDLDGNETWPSWVRIQEFFLRFKWMIWIIGTFWTIVSAIIGAITALVGLPFWHGKP